MSLSVLGQLKGGNNICFLERRALHPQRELFLFAQIAATVYFVHFPAMFAVSVHFELRDNPALSHFYP